MFLTVSSLHGQTKYRRGNPTTATPRSEFFIVDSDDDSPLKPTYHWVDTSWVRGPKWPWHQVTGFSNNDNASVFLPKTYDSSAILFFMTMDTVLPPPSSYVVSTPLGPVTINVPGGSISTNGTICLLGKDSSPVNVPMDDFTDIGTDLVAPLWSDWELLTSGSNQTKIYVRPALDTFYVAYYNLGLKGTNGQVRATFEVAFNPFDSSITFEYKSFDGSWNGVPAASIIQRVATIGMSSSGSLMGATYLHRGYYNATSANPSYALNLHAGLAVRFVHLLKEAFLISSIEAPPKEHYELGASGATFQPSCKILNYADTSVELYLRTTITNVATGAVWAIRNDSLYAAQQTNTTYTGPLTSTIPCGNYKITFAFTYALGASDAWAGNNTASRYFSVLNGVSSPFREEFDSTLISPCTWTNVGAQSMDAASVMTVPCAPIKTGSGPRAAVLNRLDASGNYYLQISTGGDTLISAPIDVSKAGSSVYVSFRYQRGLSTDSTQAGILSRLRSGPEMEVHGAQGGLPTLGDSLVIEGLLSSGTKWNPSDASWKVLTTIPGGFDIKPQVFMSKLDNTFLSDHFRLRIRVKAYNSASPVNLLEDADNWVIDGLHVEPMVLGKTDLEPIDVDFGNGSFTHIPRDLADNLVPKVRILNRGDGVPLGTGIIRLVIKDAFGRWVYDKTRLFDFSYPLRDSVFVMPNWDLHGTQGGVLTAIVQLEGLYFDSYNKNDTNIFYKTMYIDDSYALDDGGIDTASTKTTGPSEWYYKFSPVSDDTLRGISMYYTAGGATTNWTLTITGGGLNINKNITNTPSSPGWVRTTFSTPVALAKDSSYLLHFLWNYGPKTIGGDASKGLAYYTVVDSSGSSSQFGVLHPEVLSNFLYPGGTLAYTIPYKADVDQGGFLLPMFRLIYSGAQNYLPVELASLSATREANGAVAILWKTANELNAAAFEVEREGSSTLAGSVSAKNAPSGANYAIVDKTAPQGTTTYQLFERDLNGERRSLGRVTVGPVEDVNALSIVAYPNPTGSSITIGANRALDAVELIDQLGRSVRLIQPAATSATLDLTTLQNGSYFLIGVSGGEIVRTKISVMH